ncbi:Crp/Fnr family transcriptional regulator [Rufibacter tibetensis]|uniref:Crp/Fnr family transcriptional regulator n=1 Tax=Rufibacter tibetensis TaxID=512763 RepID=A0A0P0CLZ8_9BACT|nr:Crp/Fnr family transcriptional regulator [Rufibacter tibetensis]ALI97901.1 Crp/Fnr family transcriptional regulator [Rufibacter tibetensis]
MDTLEQTLQKYFSGLEPSLRQELLQEGTVKRLPEGETIIRTDQYLKSSILLLNGLLKVYREDEEGNEFLMYFLEPGHACALSMLCAARDEQSKISAQAVTDADVLLVPMHVAERWLGKYPSWHNFVIGTYRERFEELLQTLDAVAFKSLDERLLFYLKKNQEVKGNQLKLSHQQIAEELNSSREVISRLLKKLEQRGLLTLHRNYIELHQLDK